MDPDSLENEILFFVDFVKSTLSIQFQRALNDYYMISLKEDIGLFPPDPLFQRTVLLVQNTPKRLIT